MNRSSNMSKCFLGIDDSYMSNPDLSNYRIKERENISTGGERREKEQKTEE